MTQEICALGSAQRRHTIITSAPAKSRWSGRWEPAVRWGPAVAESRCNASLRVLRCQISVGVRCYVHSVCACPAGKADPAGCASVHERQAAERGGAFLSGADGLAAVGNKSAEEAPGVCLRIVKVQTSSAL